MKKISNFYILCTSITLLMSSCTPKEEKLDFLSVGGNVVLIDTKISRLDINNDVKFNVFNKEGVQTSNIVAFNNTSATNAAPVIIGSKIDDLTNNMSGNAFLKTSSMQTLPAFASNLTSGSSVVRLAIQSNYSDGTNVLNPFSLTIARGINWRILNSDGVEVDLTSASPLSTSAVFNDNTLGTNILKYKTYKKYTSTVITSVIAEWKKGETGTYAPVIGNFPTTTGTIDLGNIPYSIYGLAVGDTLYYKLTVTSGTHTDLITAKILIKP